MTLVISLSKSLLEAMRLLTRRTVSNAFKNIVVHDIRRFLKIFKGPLPLNPTCNQEAHSKTILWVFPTCQCRELKTSSFRRSRYPSNATTKKEPPPMIIFKSARKILIEEALKHRTRFHRLQSVWLIFEDLQPTTGLHP